MWRLLEVQRTKLQAELAAAGAAELVAGQQEQLMQELLLLLQGLLLQEYEECWALQLMGQNRYHLHSQRGAEGTLA